VSQKTIDRKTFIKAASIAVAATAGAGLVEAAPQKSSERKPEQEKMIGIQIGAVSFFDEGVNQVLDNVQETARVNTLFIPVFAYNRGLAGRQIPGQPFPDHGPKEVDKNFVGGYFATMHEKYYNETVYKPKYARAPELGNYDVLADVMPEAKKRGMKVYAFFADNFGKKRPYSEQLCERDLHGNNTGNVNLINPNFRAFLFGMMEDCIRSYDIDGLLWRSERLGPMSNLLDLTHSSVVKPASFDEYTIAKAKDRGINVDKAFEGYMALEQFVKDCKSVKKPVDGYYVTFWRILFLYPEILAWHQLWVDGLRDTYQTVYRFAKSIRPDLDVGWALSFKGLYNHFYRSRQDLQELGKYSDFLKIVMYNNVGGQRFYNYLDRANKTLYGDMDFQESLDLTCSIMGYENIDFKNIRENGIPCSVITSETERSIKGAAGTNTKIWPAIDIDIPTYNPEASRCTPESRKQAVLAAFKGGAEGILLARKYSEMNLSSLKGVGLALEELNYN